MSETEQIQQRNRCIKMIQDKFSVGYARAAHMYMILINEPMFIVYEKP